MKRKLIVLALALTVLAAGAFADDLRTPQVGLSSSSLQGILDNIYGAGNTIQAYGSQQAAQTWELPGNPPQGTLPILQATNADNGDAVGIYTVGGAQVLIFQASASVGVSATLMFNNNNTMTISGSDCSQVNCGTYSGINQSSFGFYINDQTAGATFYTQDSLNGGTAHALTYVNPTTDRWTIAFNDSGSDSDFDDRVFSVESITAPEPASIMLLGFGLLGFGKKLYKK